MYSGNASCFRALMSHIFGQCLMCSGNVSCFRALMSYVFGQCLMYLGNASCVRAMSHVFGQCRMYSSIREFKIYNAASLTTRLNFTSKMSAGQFYTVIDF